MELTTYAFADKKRFGVNSDGGYVVAMLPNARYDAYISAGVSNEESFSRDFISFYGMTKSNCFAFDGTIHSYPEQYTKEITFIRKNIGAISNDHETNLSDLTSTYSNIFLKMDIEGGEFVWLKSVSSDTLSKFSQIVIEFHGINDNNWGTSYPDKVACMKKLTETHYAVHCHGNNFASTTNGIPDVIEITYVRKDLFPCPPALNSVKLPIPNLDFPNNVTRKDIDLGCKPFCNL